MKSLTAALTAALGAPVQQPAALVQIAWSTVWRGTTGAPLTWNGFTWPRRDMDLEGLIVGALDLSGTLVLGNPDDLVGALLLNEGAADVGVQIWAYDAAATGTADVVLIAGAAIGTTYSLSEREARIALVHRARHLLGPRTWITPEAFGPLLPAGATVRINGSDLTLDRR